MLTDAVTGEQPKKAYWRFRSSTKRSLRRRIRGSSAWSTCAWAASLIWMLEEMVRICYRRRGGQFTDSIQKCSRETSESLTTIW